MNPAIAFVNIFSAMNSRIKFQIYLGVETAPQQEILKLEIILMLEVRL